MPLPTAFLANQDNKRSQEALKSAERHINDILNLAMLHTPQQAAVVVSDSNCELAVALTHAYQCCLPNATFIDFNSETPDKILAEFTHLKPQDLVVLIQSTNFRLEAFRLRIELFKRSLKVIEHPHLARMVGQEALYYIDALAYDAHYFRGTGSALKRLIDQSTQAVVDSDGEQLIFSSGLEPAKLNIGDYEGMTNIGGQFPIGEVFTEARDLTSVNGRVRIFVFGDTQFKVNQPPSPITLVIHKGQVTEAINSTPEFDTVLENIRKDEGVVWLRELGFGMNKALTPQRTVSDIGTFERMCGVHLSLGAKHGVFKKENISRSQARHHVDVFAVTHRVYLDDQIIFADGQWKI
jgi:aminopeptidase